jgi:hypothetical protein
MEQPPAIYQTVMPGEIRSWTLPASGAGSPIMLVDLGGPTTVFDQRENRVIATLERGQKSTFEYVVPAWWQFWMREGWIRR